LLINKRLYFITTNCYTYTADVTKEDKKDILRKDLTFLKPK